ncbi:hypothetical protein PENSPDRAFT_749071 [Peniophora sp. CONT]|nr:hypothetical protein PENSPDRAFT_749071 [Peniophora sp. CONT]
MGPKPRMVRKNAPTSTAMPGPSTMAAMSSTAPAPAPAAASGPSQIPPSIPSSASNTLSTGRSTPTGVNSGKGPSTAANANKSSPMAASSNKGSPMAANASKGSPMPGNASKSMPPPPAPAAPKAILEAEVDAMSRAFRTAAVKTGQIYGFYADTAKLGIQNYAPRPPASLTTGLARHVEQYDQLCDRVEAHLLRAIAVLQRDLQRERAAEEEARMVIASPEPEPEVTAPPPTAGLPGLEMSPPLSAGGMNQTQSGRRPSTISLSSLNRPQFAHKLDLSEATLRFSPESLSAAAAATGLDPATLASMGRPPSPVTLAPKSARLELGPEFMGLLEGAASSSNVDRPVDIDLTLDDDVPAGVGSADQPIELDLDMDLFGDASMSDVPVKKEPGTEGLDMELLNSLAPKDGTGASDADLLAQLSQTGDASGSGDFNLDMSALPNMNMDVSGNLNMDLGIGSGMDLSQDGGLNLGESGGMNLGEGAGMDVGMDMNLDFSGVPLSDVDFSGVPGGGGVDMLDMDALLGSGSATGDGAGTGETKEGGTL